MGMDRQLIALFDELEKLGVNKALSHFTQARLGRRPIRASTLLDKEKEKEDAFDRKREQDENPEDRKDYEVEGGLGMTEHPEG